MGLDTPNTEQAIIDAGTKVGIHFLSNHDFSYTDRVPTILLEYPHNDPEMLKLSPGIIERKLHTALFNALGEKLTERLNRKILDTIPVWAEDNGWERTEERHGNVVVVRLRKIA